LIFVLLETTKEVLAKILVAILNPIDLVSISHMVSSPSFISVDEIQWSPAKDEIAEKNDNSHHFFPLCTPKGSNCEEQDDNRKRTISTLIY
jgi:hypothetical protein